MIQIKTFKTLQFTYEGSLGKPVYSNHQFQFEFEDLILPTVSFHQIHKEIKSQQISSSDTQIFTMILN